MTEVAIDLIEVPVLTLLIVRSKGAVRDTAHVQLLVADEEKLPSSYGSHT